MPSDRLPVALIHGMLGGPEVWAPLVEALGPTAAPLLAITLPGHGLTPWGTDLATFEDAVDAVAARLPERFGVVGYSLGGRFALALAARHPSRIAWAAAIGADLGIEDERERRSRRSWDRSLAALARARGMEALVCEWERLPVFETQRGVEPGALAAQRERRLAHDPAGIAWALETLGTGSMRPLWAGLERAGIPTLLVAGSLDTKFARVAQRAAQRIRGARAALVEGAGHSPLLEAPDALAGLLRPLLDGEAWPVPPAASRRDGGGAPIGERRP